MAVDTREFLTRSRRRATAAILRHAEGAEWYSALTDVEREELREKVLSALGNYHDAALDMLSALDGTGPLNQRAIELLEAIHGVVTVPERPLPATG